MGELDDEVQTVGPGQTRREVCRPIGLDGLPHALDRGQRVEDHAGRRRLRAGLPVAYEVGAQEFEQAATQDGLAAGVEVHSRAVEVGRDAATEGRKHGQRFLHVDGVAAFVAPRGPDALCGLADDGMADGVKGRGP